MLEEANQASDEDIVKMVQAGKVVHFGRLVERYEAKMLRYGRKFLFGYNDIEDYVQEVFLKAYINIQSFDTSKKFSSWLYRIAHNEFVNALKKKKKEPLPFFNPDTLFPHPVAKENPEEEASRKELAGTLDGCLDKLKPKYREPLVLYYSEGLSYKEIADVLRIPINAVGVRLQRGKKMLKSLPSTLNMSKAI